jgi:predicted MFS family arabinose efflux permease
MTPPSPARTVLSLGTTQTLAWGSTYYLPAILAIPMAGDLGLPPGWVFGAFSAALVLSALFGPVAGRRIDRFGGRDVLAASNLIFALGLVMLGLAQGAVMLVAGWLIIGAGMSMGLYEGAFATLAGIYGRKARGAIVGVTLMAGFASTICWPITAFMEAELGWRAACFIWAGIHLLVGLPVNRLMIPRITRPAPQTVAPQPQDTGSRKEVGSPTRDSALVLIAFVLAVSWFIGTAMAAHLPRLLQDTGISPATAVAIAALIGPAQVAARLADYLLLRYFHPLVSARVATLAHPVGAAAILILGAPAAVFFTLLHGAGHGILSIAKGTLPLAIFGPQDYGHRMGVLMAPARFAQAGAPFVFALLIERFSTGVLLISGLLGVAAFAALWFLGTADRPD